MIQMFDAHGSMVRRPFCKRAAAPAMTSNMAKGIKYMQIQFGVDLKCGEMHQTYANLIRARPQIWQTNLRKGHQICQFGHQNDFFLGIEQC